MMKMSDRSIWYILIGAWSIMALLVCGVSWSNEKDSSSITSNDHVRTADTPSSRTIIATGATNRNRVITPDRATTGESRTQISDTILSLWLKRKQTLKSLAASDSGPGSITEIRDLLHQRGFTAYPGMEGNLIHEAYGALSENSPERANAALQSALLINDSYMPTHLALAEINFRSRLMGFWSAFGHLIDAATAIPDQFWFAFTGLTNTLIILLVATLVFFALFFFSLFFRHQARFRHLMLENRSGIFSVSLRGSISWAIVLAPLFLFLEPFWLFLYWTVLFWGFFQKHERVMVLVGLIFLSLFIPSLDTVESSFRDMDTAEMRTVADALERRVVSGERREILNSSIDDGEGRPFIEEKTFILADLYLKEGEDDRTFELYSRIPKYHRLYPMSLNNMGNIFFSMREYDKSIQYYRKALDVKPEYAECCFNLSSAYFQLYEFDQSDQALSRAQRIDPLKVGALILAESRGRKALEYHIPRTFLWEMAGESIQRNMGRHFPWIGGTDRIDRGRTRISAAMLIASTLAIMAGMLFAWLGRSRKVELCQVCGQAFCQKCGPEKRTGSRCLPCTHLFTTKANVAPEIKRFKLRQISLFTIWKRFREILFTLFLPGLERMRQGRYALGSVVLWCWLVVLTAFALSPGHLPLFSWKFAVWSWNPFRLTGLLLLAVIWLANAVPLVLDLRNSRRSLSTTETVKPQSEQRMQRAEV